MDQRVAEELSRSQTGVHPRIVAEEKDGKYNIHETRENKQASESICKQVKQHPGEQGGKIHFSSPALKIPESYAGYELSRDDDAIKSRGKKSEFFDLRREHLRKGKKHPDVTNDTNDGDDLWSFHISCCVWPPPGQAERHCKRG